MRGKSKVFFINELAMQDSHPSLYSTKTFYHLYVSDPFLWCTENVNYFILISLEYTENDTDHHF